MGVVLPGSVPAAPLLALPALEGMRPPRFKSTHVMAGLQWRDLDRRAGTV